MSRGTARSIITSGRPIREAATNSSSSRPRIWWGAPVELTHDVRTLELAGQVVERDRAAAVALGQPERAVVAAVGHEQRLHAAVAQGARRELGVLAGADHEHAPLGQVAEEVGRQLHGHRGHGHARARHVGLGPHALAGGRARRGTACS